MNDTYTPIWDAVGIINGTNQDEVVIVGNHRDAWIIGGAAVGPSLSWHENHPNHLIRTPIQVPLC
jgi:hypothetical protein